ncbi:sulfotransferase [Oceanihabitans sediminis]|uniref:sulfotransferase n=1 Tax=Oceanihabitans sediminis TaxID=1812012 RepID=UPI00299E5FF1|nr:sulfotransferase [Oceanihabitans sediminis]MDX1774895.1 sulfotransferase [Oceanihabitans sediminis]
MSFLKKHLQEKVFCIGLNKTGTTTIETVLSDFGYKLGLQPEAELLAKDWYNRDFNKIIKYCSTADAFQDIPFSLPFTYAFLDQHFKNAKFILTVRDNPNQWYNSITNFHSKLWANGKDLPTIKELKEAKYRYKGFPFEINRYMFNSPIDAPYDKNVLLDYYINHNYSVIEYFRSKPDKLLVINVAEETDYLKLCKFLNKEPLHDGFPWKNKTSSI